MTTVDRWTGRETRQLRVALRLTVRAFAEMLGVSPRTISKWEAGGADHEPRPELQAALDTMLCRASSAERERFVGSVTQPQAVAADPSTADAKLLGIGDTWERDGTRVLADFLASNEELTPDVAVRLTHEWRAVEPPQVIELRAGRRVGARLADVVQERVEVLRRMDDFVGGGDLHDLVRTELRATVDLVRDVSFGEDHSTSRTSNGPINLATIRAAVINAIKDAGYLHIPEGRRDHLNPQTPSTCTDSHNRATREYAGALPCRPQRGSSPAAGRPLRIQR